MSNEATATELPYLPGSTGTKYIMLAKNGNVALGFVVANVRLQEVGDDHILQVSLKVRSSASDNLLNPDGPEELEPNKDLFVTSWPAMSFSKWNKERASGMVGMSFLLGEDPVAAIVGHEDELMTKVASAIASLAPEETLLRSEEEIKSTFAELVTNAFDRVVASYKAVQAEKDAFREKGFALSFEGNLNPEKLAKIKAEQAAAAAAQKKEEEAGGGKVLPFGVKLGEDGEPEGEDGSDDGNEE